MRRVVISSALVAFLIAAAFLCGCFESGPAISKSVLGNLVQALRRCSVQAGRMFLNGSLLIFLHHNAVRV